MVHIKPSGTRRSQFLAQEGAVGGPPSWGDRAARAAPASLSLRGPLEGRPDDQRLSFSAPAGILTAPLGNTRGLGEKRGWRGQDDSRALRPVTKDRRRAPASPRGSAARTETCRRPIGAPAPDHAPPSIPASGRRLGRRPRGRPTWLPGRLGPGAPAAPPGRAQGPPPPPGPRSRAGAGVPRAAPRGPRILRRSPFLGGGGGGHSARSLHCRPLFGSLRGQRGRRLCVFSGRDPRGPR